MGRKAQDRVSFSLHVDLKERIKELEQTCAAQAAEIERLRKACLHVIEIDRLAGGAESSEKARELRHLPDDSVMVGDLLEGMGVAHVD